MLSSSPQELVERIGQLLGMHRSIGTRATLVNGRYTGGLDCSLCYGPRKIAALRLAPGDVDLHEAFAYADSASDLALLRACGLAVNPDRTLRRVAHQEGWPILVSGDASGRPSRTVSGATHTALQPPDQGRGSW